MLSAPSRPLGAHRPGRDLRIGEQQRQRRARVRQPDDGNADDHTLARLPLAKPVPPRARRSRCDFDFAARLPRLFMRSGHAAPFFFVAQWFPKLAVFGEDGVWHAHQYHAESEFFADFATYDVTLTVPADYVVGAPAMTRRSATTATARRR